MEQKTPEAGQESVWDYPRPPRLEPTARHLRVVFNGTIIADTRRAWRVLETSHPPTYYIPPEDVHIGFLFPTPNRSVCEFKGGAIYWTVRVHDRAADNAAWSYPAPMSGFEAIKDYVAFYAGRVDACYVDGEKVQPQSGDFYGGWVTSDIVGPFKGGPGTQGW